MIRMTQSAELVKNKLSFIIKDRQNWQIAHTMKSEAKIQCVSMSLFALNSEDN